MCDALHDLLDNIVVRFGSKLYRQIVGIPIDTICAPLVADLFLFCYVWSETSFCLCQTIIKLILLKLLTNTSIYLDDLLNIDNPYFEQKR